MSPLSFFHPLSKISFSFSLLFDLSGCQNWLRECSSWESKIFEENKREDIVTMMARHTWMTPNIASIQNMYLLYIYTEWSTEISYILMYIRVRLQEIVRQYKCDCDKIKAYTYMEQHLLIIFQVFAMHSIMICINFVIYFFKYFREERNNMTHCLTYTVAST